MGSEEGLKQRGWLGRECTQRYYRGAGRDGADGVLTFGDFFGGTEVGLVEHDDQLRPTVTGGDQVTAERKHGHPFTFTNRALMIFSANETPGTAERGCR